MTHSREPSQRTSSRTGTRSLLIISIVLAIILSSIDILSGMDRTDGSIEAFFCGNDDCPGIVSAQLSKANRSIDCAFYDLDNHEIISALDTSGKDTKTRLILEKGNLKSIPDEVSSLLARTEYRNDTNPGYMHNKFCIIDNRIAITGSFNPTDNDAYRNNNNIVVMHSEDAASDFNDEFEEMWSGTFGKGRNVAIPYTRIGNSSIGIFFCPEDRCSERISDEIERAEHTIRFMAFSFTDQMISESIVKMHKRNISVSGIIENNQKNVMGSRYEFLRYHGINVTIDRNKYFMHHKVFIIDDDTVITGSMNPTSSGDSRNDENIIIIHDKNLTRRYLHEYERIS